MKVVTGFFTVISIAALSMTAAQAAFVENKYNCEMSMEEAVD